MEQVHRELLMVTPRLTLRLEKFMARGEPLEWKLMRFRKDGTWAEDERYGYYVGEENSYYTIVKDFEELPKYVWYLYK